MGGTSERGNSELEVQIPTHFEESFLRDTGWRKEIQTPVKMSSQWTIHFYYWYEWIFNVSQKLK
jgi:hypothetical protein